MAKTAPKRRVKITDTERLDFLASTHLHLYRQRWIEGIGFYLASSYAAVPPYDVVYPTIREAIDEAMRASQKKESK